MADIEAYLQQDTEEMDGILEVIDCHDYDSTRQAGWGLSDAAEQYIDDMGMDRDDVDNYSVFDYMQDVLEYRTTRDSSGQVTQVQLLVAFGGPNIWHDIDPDGRYTIRASWWMDSGTASHRHELQERIFDAIAELEMCS